VAPPRLLVFGLIRLIARTVGNAFSIGWASVGLARGEASRRRPCTWPLAPNPLLSQAPIPSAVDPHVCGAGVVHGVQVERATVRTTWTPWAASARLCLGRRWTGWEPPRAPRCARGRERRPLPPGAGRSPAGGIVSDQGRRMPGAPLVALAPSICGWASAQPGRSGPKAGAAPRAEPGSPPGGAERSRVLEPVEKVVTQASAGMCQSGAA
jgi:hypothetical protein